VSGAESRRHPGYGRVLGDRRRRVEGHQHEIGVLRGRGQKGRRRQCDLLDFHHDIATRLRVDALQESMGGEAPPIQRLVRAELVLAVDAEYGPDRVVDEPDLAPG
jgi:hypothetical protein